MNSTAVWLLLIFGVLFIGLKGFEISGVDIAERAPWRKKQMIMVETAAKEPKNGNLISKRRWFANKRIGNNIYEWDDINIHLISGDTIIDLGNTSTRRTILLLFVKVFSTRILVPLGVAILCNIQLFTERYVLKKKNIN